MSRFRRGICEREDSQSNMELKLMTMFQWDYLEKRIPEMPITPPWTDILLSLDRKDPFITRPDFRWVYTGKLYWHPVYIDGAPHRSAIISRRDKEISELLDEQGYHPHRYDYKADTKAETVRIHDQILDDLALEEGGAKDGF